MGILIKEKLANYICSEYQRVYGNKITPIKLQKSLYFLYAFWGGKIRRAKKCDNQGESCLIEDDTIKNNDENLFDANFEAWSYGPVDREIYTEFKNGKLFEIGSNNLFLEGDILVKGFVDSMLTRIFNTNDFALVDLSHQDEAWTVAYNIEESYKPINNESIIEEYSIK